MWSRSRPTYRRTFAEDLLDASADMVTAQKLMGHSSARDNGRV